MYTVSLNRIIGIYQCGKFAYAGKFLYSKHNSIELAKARVTEEFKRGYFNHAEIYSRHDETNIERFKGNDWITVKEV